MYLLEAENHLAPRQTVLESPKTPEEHIRSIKLKRSHNDGFHRCRAAAGRTCKCNLTLAVEQRSAFDPQLLLQGLAK